MRVGALHTDAPQEMINVKGNNALVGVKIGVGRDLTNDRFNPSEGYTFNADYEQVVDGGTFGIEVLTYGTKRFMRICLSEKLFWRRKCFRLLR